MPAVEKSPSGLAHEYLIGQVHKGGESMTRPVQPDDLVREWSTLQQALQDLPGEIQHAMKKVYLEGASWGEVGTELGENEKTLKFKVDQHLKEVRLSVPHLSRHPSLTSMLTPINRPSNKIHLWGDGPYDDTAS